MSRVRALAELLTRNPKYLSLNKERATQFAQAFKDAEISLPTWDYEGFYPETDDLEEICLFFLIFNSINYCYFDSDGNRFQDGNLRGSSLMTTRLLEGWTEIRDPYFLSQVDENFLLSELLRAEQPISLVKQRTEALRELGRFLNANVDFTFEKFFRKYRRNAYFVSQAIPTLLPSWRDPFYKRSQLFVSMVAGRFQHLSEDDRLLEEESLRDITIFSDYRVPQTLAAVGIIEYGPELQDAISTGRFIESGSQKELEIRAASVVSGDMITGALKEFVDDEITALHADYILWSAGHSQENFPEELLVGPWPKNHHYCLTTDY